MPEAPPFSRSDFRLTPRVFTLLLLSPNRRRIAGENLGSKGIDLVGGNFHFCLLFRSANVGRSFMFIESLCSFNG